MQIKSGDDDCGKPGPCVTFSGHDGLVHWGPSLCYHMGVLSGVLSLSVILCLVAVTSYAAGVVRQIDAINSMTSSLLTAAERSEVVPPVGVRRNTITAMHTNPITMKPRRLTTAGAPFSRSYSDAYRQAPPMT